jgi:hypothetical protein
VRARVCVYACSALVRNKQEPEVGLYKIERRMYTVLKGNAGRQTHTSVYLQTMHIGEHL